MFVQLNNELINTDLITTIETQIEVSYVKGNTVQCVYTGLPIPVVQIIPHITLVLNTLYKEQIKHTLTYLIPTGNNIRINDTTRLRPPYTKYLPDVTGKGMLDVVCIRESDLYTDMVQREIERTKNTFTQYYWNKLVNRQMLDLSL